MTHEKVGVLDVIVIKGQTDAIFEESDIQTHIGLLLFFPCEVGRSAPTICAIISFAVRLLRQIECGIQIVIDILITNNTIAGTNLEAREYVLLWEVLLIGNVPCQGERWHEAPAMAHGKL